MLADAPRRSLGCGVLTLGVHAPGTFVMRIIDFIADQLCLWRDYPNRPRVESEAALTAQLGAYLNTAARNSLDVVQFRTEVPDSVQPGRRLDMAVQPSISQILVEGRSYTLFDAILPIECKRLPTPNGYGRDEREYVIVGNGGTTGGIQRFKLGAHGAAHAVALIIGYIQDGDAEHWLQMVNGWLAEAGRADPLWAGEQLAAARGGEPSAVHRFSSTHRRLRGSGNVGLWHLWIAMATGSMKRRSRRAGRRPVQDRQLKMPFVSPPEPSPAPREPRARALLAPLRSHARLPP